MVLQYLSSKYFSLLHRNVQGGFFMRFSIRRLVWNFFFRMAVGLVLIVAGNFVCTLANIPLWVGINLDFLGFQEFYCSMESLVMDCKFLCKREKKKSGLENPDVFQPAFSVHFCVWTNMGIACIMKPSQKQILPVRQTNPQI